MTLSFFRSFSRSPSPTSVAGAGVESTSLADAASSSPAAPTFEALYDDHVDFVWRSAMRLGVGESAADDVVQQTFLVVHRRLGEFEGRSSIKTWVFAILLRVVQDHRRSLRRKSPHLFHEPEDPEVIPDGATASNPQDALLRAEASRTIDLLLESLDGDKRVVFVLAEIEEMTADEISQATGLDRLAVYSRLRAARTDFERAAARMRQRTLAEERRSP